MSEHNDGGPAFPYTHFDLSDGEGGMTLRDYFAAKAMAYVPAQAAHNMLNNESNAGYLARRAYEYADAMLAAREVKL